MAKTKGVGFRVWSIRVVDSDTIEGWVQIDPKNAQLWRIRLKRVEGGELNTEEGMAGKASLAEELCKDPFGEFWISGNPYDFDKYGRHVCEIVDRYGVSLNTRLIEKGTHWRRTRSGKHLRKGWANNNDVHGRQNDL